MTEREFEERLKRLEKKIEEQTKIENKAVKDFLGVAREAISRVIELLARYYNPKAVADIYTPLLAQIEKALVAVFAARVLDLKDRDAWVNRYLFPALEAGFRDAIEIFEDLGVKRLTLSPELVKVSYQSTKIAIKGATDEMKKAVQRVLLQASVVPDMSLDEVMDALVDEHGFFESIPKHRLETIARSELNRAYREAFNLVNKELGARKFKYVGPLDERTSAICRANLGKVRTKEEWLRLNPLVFSYGLHPNCRHRLIPVPETIKTR